MIDKGLILIGDSTMGVYYHTFSIFLVIILPSVVRKTIKYVYFMHIYYNIHKIMKNATWKLYVIYYD